MLKIFLEMNECAGRLDQAFEKIGIARSCFQPKLLEDIVRFIIALFIPAMKERTIKWMLRDRPAATTAPIDPLRHSRSGEAGWLSMQQPRNDGSARSLRLA